MNLELLDPFEQDFPELIEDKLMDHCAGIVAFNHQGSVLAAGCLDGRVVLWDFDTRGVSKVFKSHVWEVTSLSWDSSDVFLLSTSRDWTAVLWDTRHGVKVSDFYHDTPISCCRLHPVDSHLSILCPATGLPLFVTFSKAGGPLVHRLDQVEPVLEEGETVTGAEFFKNGEKLLLCTSKGSLILLDVHSREVKQTLKLTAGSAIKTLYLSPDESELAVNAADRIIRTFSILDHNGSLALEPMHKFQDLVNRNQWSMSKYSNKGDYVVAGSASKESHDIYIWDKRMGSLVKMLEGPREGLFGLTWHPVRAIVASVSGMGPIYIWSIPYQQHWSAFAPDFEELEENIEYVEREDEFDDVPAVVESPTMAREDYDGDIAVV